MALITEDGTGKSDAESYLSVVDADTYHTSFGNTTWTAASTSDKEVALRKATQYLDQKYHLQWKGERTWADRDDQKLDWPRSGVRDRNTLYDSNEIPTSLKDATAVLALEALSADLVTTVTVANQGIKKKFTRADTVATSTEYAGIKATQKKYTLAGNMLSGLLRTANTVERS